MTTVNRFLAALVAVLSAVGITEYLLWQHAASRADDAEASLKAVQAENDTLRKDLKSTRASLTARSAALSAAKKAQEDQRRRLDHELQENPAWAGAAVPDAVWDGLYAKSADGASAPAARITR
ncbi:hypothetical protein Q3O87_21570 [Ralstonia pseudosolanacearum]|nr:hypothetical protein [Ralstonia pseudosolanacearum]MDO3588295.1 hypothetical protein [Ralstonia pseudosolanacearum]